MNKLFQVIVITLLLLSTVLSPVYSSPLSQNSFEKSNVYKVSTYPGSRQYGTAFSIQIRGITYILTNNHVCAVSGKDKLWVQNEYTDKWHQLRVIDRSGEYDLCLLESDTITTGLTLGEKGGWLGDIIRTMGHPEMRPLTESRGKIKEISELGVSNRDLQTKKACNKPWMKWITEESFFGPQSFCIETRESYLTDALVLPGSSGSPVFNEKGLVVGIVYAAGPDEGLFIGVEWILKFIAKTQSPSD